MDIQEKVDKDYLKAFNLGYEIASELNLNSPMFKNHNVGGTGNNPIQAGMHQYIKENLQNLGITAKASLKRKIIGKNKGEGLIP